MYVGVHMQQRHSNDSATEKKREWKKWLDVKSLIGFLCLRYCRSLNGKISASAFGGHLYRDMTSFARVVNY